MINRIVIELPLPKRWGRFSYTKKKKVGFSFDNLAKFNFSEIHKILDKPGGLKSWIKDNGQNAYMAEALYCAHLSYNMHNRINDVVERGDFMSAINKFSDSAKGKKVMEDVVNVWSRSESFGSKEVPGKKKATQKS